MRSHSGFLVPSVMETHSGRLRLFAASDSDSEMDFTSDSEIDSRKDDCDDEVRWAYVETMLDADAVKPDKRLRKKTPDTFTMAPLEINKTPVRRTSDVLGEHMGLRGVELRRLLRMNLPAMLFNIFIAITRIFALNPIRRDLDCVEMFSGKATIRDAFRASGGRALGYDITYDPSDNDLNSVTGFCVAVVLTMRLKSRSVQWWATVCSSWVWMSRSTCERSKNRSGGNRQVPCVKSANCQVARMALISALGLSRGTSWGLEQPSSSLMRYSWHVRFLEKVAKILGLSFTDIACDMGAYNADTKKPTKIYAMGGWTQTLARRASMNFQKKKNTTTITTSASGRKQVTGSADLKETQAYTPEFGRAVCRAWQLDQRRSDQMFGPHDDSDTEWEIDYGEKHWEEADLDGVCKRLRVPRRRLIFNVV